MRRSCARTRSHACKAAPSKSGSSAGRTCHPVTSVPKTRMERMLGNSPLKLSWCSGVVASHTPSSSAVSFFLSRSAKTILSPTYTPRQPNIDRVVGERDAIASSTNRCGTSLRGFEAAGPSSNGRILELRLGLGTVFMIVLPKTALGELISLPLSLLTVSGLAR